LKYDYSLFLPPFCTRINPSGLPSGRPSAIRGGLLFIDTLLVRRISFGFLPLFFFENPPCIERIRWSSRRLFSLSSFRQVVFPRPFAFPHPRKKRELPPNVISVNAQIHSRLFLFYPLPCCISIDLTVRFWSPLRGRPPLAPTPHPYPFGLQKRTTPRARLNLRTARGPCL